MHAGRSFNSSTGNNYANYVAAGRCLYNCAYLMWASNYNKNQLKAYTDKWYNSNVQSASAKNDARKDLRYVIDAAYDHDIARMGSKVELNRRRQLQFLGFAIYAVTDAYIWHRNHDLDLSRNASLRFLYLMSKIKLKRLTMPALKNKIIPVYHTRRRCKVEVLDLSRIKRFTERTRGVYLHPFQSKQTYKKVVVSKKLKKSHRNWFKKKAKKVKAKVIMR